MRLYYTVAAGAEVAQIEPNFSLGGYKSSSPLVNSQFGNLFSDITAVTVNNFNQNQYVGLVLKNETVAPVVGVKLWFEYPTGCYSLFRVAAVDMVADASRDLAMEHITELNSKPLSADFFEAAEVANSVDLGDLAIGEQIGIWIERELLPEVIVAQQALVYEPDPLLESRFKEVVLPKIDEIKIGISWT